MIFLNHMKVVSVQENASGSGAKLIKFLIFVVIVASAAIAMGLFLGTGQQTTEDSEASTSNSYTVCVIAGAEDCDYSGTTGLTDAIAAAPDGYTIYIKPSATVNTLNVSNITVTNKTLHFESKGGMVVLDSSFGVTPSFDFSYTSNTSAKSSISGFLIKGGTDTPIIFISKANVDLKNNIIVGGVDTDGIRVNGNINNSVSLTNNVFNSISGNVVRANAVATGNLVIKNNIFSNTVRNSSNSGGNVFDILGTGVTVTTSYNNFWQNAVGCGSASLCLTTGSLSLDPKFADVTSVNYRLQSTSALINVGDPIILDPDGSRSDIGAYGGPGLCLLDPNASGCVTNPTDHNLPCSSQTGDDCVIDTYGITDFYAGNSTETMTAYGRFWNYTLNSDGTYDGFDNNATELTQIDHYADGPCSGRTGDGCKFDTRVITKLGPTNVEAITAYGKYWNFNLDDNASQLPGNGTNLTAVQRYLAGPCATKSGDGCTFDTLAHLNPGDATNMREVITAYGKMWIFDYAGNVAEGNNVNLTAINRYTNGPCLGKTGAECKFDAMGYSVFGGRRIETVIAYGKFWVFDVDNNYSPLNGNGSCLTTVERYGGSVGTGDDCKTPKPDIGPSDTTIINSKDVTISVQDSGINRIVYTLNNGNEISYESATRPLSTTFTITADTVVKAKAYRYLTESEQRTKTYSTVSIGQPSSLAYSCAASGAQATFTWNAADDAEAYLLRINKEGDFRPDIADSGDQFIYTTNTSLTVSNITAGTNYLSWSIQPLISANNDPDNYAATAQYETAGGSFTCQISSTGVAVNPYPTITFLQTIQITGIKPAGVGIYVNGVLQVSPDNSTTWTASLNLAQLGQNRFEIQTITGGTIVPVIIDKCALADINCDGNVNIVDFSYFIRAIKIQYYIDAGQSVQKYSINYLSDMNQDGRNDILDFGTFKNEYLRRNA